MQTVWKMPLRPLFIIGALFSALVMMIWVLLQGSMTPFHPWGDMTFWHAHEMIFGMGAAFFVGYLLSRAQGWTGEPALNGRPLKVLVVIWLAGRLLLMLPFVPGWLSVPVDFLFLPYAAMHLSGPIRRAGDTPHLVFPPLLMAMAFFNLWSHLMIATGRYDQAMDALYGVVILMLLMLSFILGERMPVITAERYGTEQVSPQPMLELTTVFSTGCVAVLALFGQLQPGNIAGILLCGVACVAHTMRQLHWRPLQTLDEPLLWSLHLSHVFVPVGFLLLTLFQLGAPVSPNAAVHAFGVGALGGIFLAGVSRVSLELTGHRVQADPIMSMAFVSTFVAGLCWILGPTFMPMRMGLWSSLSGIFWVLAFGLFSVVYIPLLTEEDLASRTGGDRHGGPGVVRG